MMRRAGVTRSLNRRVEVRYDRGAAADHQRIEVQLSSTPASCELHGENPQGRSGSRASGESAGRSNRRGPAVAGQRCATGRPLGGLLRVPVS